MLVLELIPSVTHRATVVLGPTYPLMQFTPCKLHRKFSSFCLIKILLSNNFVMKIMKHTRKLSLIWENFFFVSEVELAERSGIECDISMLLQETKDDFFKTAVELRLRNNFGELDWNYIKVKSMNDNFGIYFPLSCLKLKPNLSKII